MDILENLIADHARLRDALALLKRALAAGDAADLYLMHRIVTHYAEYFNHVHHPLEQRVFD